MPHSDRPPVRQPFRLGLASLISVAALLAAVPAQPTWAAAGPLSADGGVPAAVSALPGNWNKPGTMSFLPDGRSALVTERHTHRVFRLGLDGSRTQIGTVPQVDVSTQEPQGGLLGVAVPPTWNGTTDQDVFFTHTTENETRVVRMSYDGTSLSGYTTVIGGIVRGAKHNGGKIAFGPDGYLYVATGDGMEAKLAQDRNSLNGKILRIARTGAPAPGNPFGTRVYSYGHRDPQGLAWDRNGRLWSTEMGEDKADELNLIKSGDDYGWPVCEGYCSVKGMTNPKQTWDPEEGVPAQVAIVRNVVYVSSLLGQQLWRIPIRGDSECTDTKTGFYNGEFGRLRALAKVPGADELWLGTSDRGGDTDEILRVTIR